jgi:hypothetical protein
MLTFRHGKATLVCTTVACASVFVASPTLAMELRDGGSRASTTFARTSSLPRCRATQLRVWDFTALESAADYGVIVAPPEREYPSVLTVWLSIGTGNQRVEWRRVHCRAHSRFVHGRLGVNQATPSR